MIDLSLIYNSLPSLVGGAIVSLQITGLSSTIGLVLGTVLGIMESSKNFLLRIPVFLYVTLFRGTPMLLQIVVIFFVLPQFGISISDFWAAVIAIGLNSSAYVSQIVRSGIFSVDKGQREAGRVIGLSRFQIDRYIVLPQAIAVVMPALGNEVTTLVKDSSLAMIIGVTELSKVGSMIRTRTLDALSTYVAVGLMYLIITSVLTLVMMWLEQKVTAHVEH